MSASKIPLSGLPRGELEALAERLLAEKQSLGFYLSGHPFSEWRAEIRRVARTPLAELRPGNEPQMAAGVIYGVAMRNSRRGRMAVLTLDDDGPPRLQNVLAR